MAAGLQRLAAERAGRSTGGDECLGPAREGAGLGGVDPHAEQVWTICRVIGQLHVIAIGRGSLGLDDHRPRFGVPGQGHGTDPEELDHGLLERVLIGFGLHRCIDRVEDVVESRGQGGHLRFLEADTDQCPTLSGLQEERAIARLADRSGDETVGVVENEKSSCHPTHRTRWRPARVWVAHGHHAASSEPELMRQRFRPLRDRAMARRPDGERRFRLTGRQRLIAGWLAAIAVILLIALAVRVLGGDGDGTPVVPSASASQTSGPATIDFGTTLEPTTGQVLASSRVDRFAEGDTFAYSVPNAGQAPSTVYVEVERVGGGVAGIVQDAGLPEGVQTVPEGRSGVGFSVPAANLLEVFGPGEYVMRIHTDPAAEPLAEGRFTLVGGPSESPAGS